MDKRDVARGSLGIAFDAVEGLTDVVEGMHRNIAGAPLGEVPRGRAPGIAGLVYASVRGVNDVLRGGTRWMLSQPEPAVDRMASAGEPWLAALNGVIGDYLERSANPLAIPMRLRHEGRDLPLDRAGLDVVLPRVSDRVLVLVHGLCMSDQQWTRIGRDGRSHDHGRALAAVTGATPLYARYNSGRHVSTNGRELAELLRRLAAAWPVRLRAITLLGHSMGGLVIRSALHTAAEARDEWVARVDRAVYLGSPHHGSVLERAGNRLHAALAWNRYSAPLAGLGTIRSAGITDLRHGNVVDDDWCRVERFGDHTDHRRVTPLTPGPAHFAIAGTLSPAATGTLAEILGDGLVHPSSATGRHDDPERSLAFADDHVRLVAATGHLELLSSLEIYAQLETWLRD